MKVSKAKLDEQIEHLKQKLEDISADNETNEYDASQRRPHLSFLEKSSVGD